MTTNDKSKRLVEKLKDKAYRNAFVISHIFNGIAFQIKALREHNEWTQKELGDRADNMRQERISVLENPNNSNVTIDVLRRIASAFDVALMIRFVPFSDLARWDANLSPEALQVASFDDDTFFKEESKTELISESISEAYKPKELSKVTYLQDHITRRNDRGSALQNMSSKDNEQTGSFQRLTQSSSIQELLMGGR